MLELRRQIEKLSTEQGSAHRSLSDARSKCNDYEDQLMQINKEMHAAQEWAKSKYLYFSRGVLPKKCISHTFFVKLKFQIIIIFSIFHEIFFTNLLNLISISRKKRGGMVPYEKLCLQFHQFDFDTPTTLLLCEIEIGIKTCHLYY